MFTKSGVDLELHVLFFTDNFPPETNAPASRTHEHTREWVKAGHAVTVVTCVPNFPNGRVFEGYKNKLCQTEVIDGIRVIRVWSYISENKGFLRRSLDYVSYMVSSFFASFFVRKVDVVIGTSPQFFTVISAWLTAKIRGKPFIFEVRDLWPESIKAVGAMDGSRLLNFFERVEIFLYREASAIVVVTNSFKKNLVKRGIPRGKIFVVTNGVDLKQFRLDERDEQLKAELGLSGKFIVGYIGTHGMAHSLETILNAAKITQNHTERSPHYVFLGSGARFDYLKLLASDLDLNNVTFLNSVPKSEVVRYWSILDVSIVHLKKTELFKSVIPSKIFESMAVGVPILLGVEGESAEIVSEMGVGLTIDPENSEMMARSLMHLSDNPYLLKLMSRNAKDSALKFDRKKLAEKMLEVVIDTSKGGGSFL